MMMTPLMPPLMCFVISLWTAYQLFSAKSRQS